jgi:hypothetical protein
MRERLDPARLRRLDERVDQAPQRGRRVRGRVGLSATLAADAAGVVDFSWYTGPSNEALWFFGLTNAPGTSITIVPEPSTAILFAIRLVLMAGKARRARW